MTILTAKYKGLDKIAGYTTHEIYDIIFYEYNVFERLITRRAIDIYRPRNFSNSIGHLRYKSMTLFLLEWDIIFDEDLSVN